MKRILVALDGSERAPVVLTAAARLAELNGAQLVLFRAIGIPQDVAREVLELTDTRLEDVLIRNAHEELTRMATSLPKNLVENITTEFATPWDGIVRAGRRFDADLIVLGAHGYGGIDRLLGTTAGKVANHTDRNVFIVRTPL